MASFQFYVIGKAAPMADARNRKLKLPLDLPTS
jgi:hypothetical protein